MTREEEIKQAAYSQYCNSESICFTLMCDSFKQGAKWADKNPINIWHNASEEPPKDTHILIETSFFKDDLDYYSCHWSTSICPSWEEYVKEYYIKRWAYISDLLPKKFGISEQLKRGKL